MKKVLICGHRSFVATGLSKYLSDNGVDNDCFSRGDEMRVNNIITGDVMDMKNNKYLDSYDTVINFILLKGENVEKTLII